MAIAWHLATITQQSQPQVIAPKSNAPKGPSATPSSPKWDFSVFSHWFKIIYPTPRKSFLWMNLALSPKECPLDPVLRWHVRSQGRGLWSLQGLGCCPSDPASFGSKCGFTVSPVGELRVTWTILWSDPSPSAKKQNIVYWGPFHWP